MRIVLVIAVACAHPSRPEPVRATATPAVAPSRPREAPRMVVTDTQLDILDPIRFAAGSAAIDPVSIPSLDALARTLVGNPSIKLVEVRAFGADAVREHRLAVASARSHAIVEAQIARGVARHRLVPSAAPQPPAGWGPEPVFAVLARDP